MKLPFEIDLSGKAVVITGAGEVLCSIADFKGFRQLRYSYKRCGRQQSEGNHRQRIFFTEDMGKVRTFLDNVYLKCCVRKRHTKSYSNLLRKIIHMKQCSA